MSQRDKAKQFAALHARGAPLVLFNAWDAGSAKAIADAGAPAIATSSWSVAAAGASGFFVPGLQEEALIARVCEGTVLPVNAMVMGGVPTNDRLAEIGVARISYGPIPYIDAMEALGQQAKGHA